jgi:hypothetical protein
MRPSPPLLTREARVRREFAHLYEASDLRHWTPAAKVVESLGTVREPADSVGARQRPLPEDQFEFRGGAPRRPGVRARTRRSD